MLHKTFWLIKMMLSLKLYCVNERIEEWMDREQTQGTDYTSVVKLGFQPMFKSNATGEGKCF